MEKMADFGMMWCSCCPHCLPNTISLFPTCREREKEDPSFFSLLDFPELFLVSVLHMQWLLNLPCSFSVRENNFTAKMLAPVHNRESCLLRFFFRWVGARYNEPYHEDVKEDETGYVYICKLRLVLWLSTRGPKKGHASSYFVPERGKKHCVCGCICMCVCAMCPNDIITTKKSSPKMDKAQSSLTLPLCRFALIVFFLSFFFPPLVSFLPLFSCTHTPDKEQTNCACK